MPKTTIFWVPGARARIATALGLVMVASALTAIPASAPLPSTGARQAQALAPNAKPPAWPVPNVPLAVPQAPVWPAAGTFTVDVPAGQEVRLGEAPLWLSASQTEATRYSVEILPQDKSADRDLAVRVTRQDSPTETGKVRLSVDTAGFQSAYGANWADRLRLDLVPPDGGNAVALRTTRRGTLLSAEVPLGAKGGVVALAADPNSPIGSGDYGASSLSSSATWTAGGGSGAFTWSYPVRVPPSLGGPAPKVGLAYSSQSVDGRTATSNGQPSWVGEGFDWAPGFIERRYASCSDDMGGTHNNSTKTGDQCWKTSNATLSLNGRGGELLFNPADGLWHSRTEDGSRIEHLTGASNGDSGDGADGTGEYWVVTTTDGTKYYFGSNRLQGWTTGKAETNSTQLVPVYGNNPNEPCYVAGNYAGSSCMQAYRWNLDYVVDPRGNTMSLWWDKDPNQYGRNNSDTDLVTYDRDAYLDHIDYGTHQRTLVGSTKTDTEYLSTAIPMRVQFAVADRCASSCWSGSNPVKANWLDVPWDLRCTASPCDDHSPAFYSSHRLATITTKVWSVDLSPPGFKPVEQWTLSHTYPDPGDGTKAGLWLNTISHTGLMVNSLSVPNTTQTLPDIVFTPIMLDNRVDTALLNGLRPFKHPRMNRITTETGGVINVNYAPQQCGKAAAETNTDRCYPVRWAPEDLGGAPGQDIVDYFHKYVVDTVIETDATAPAGMDSSYTTTTQYVYLGGGAWHFSDDDGLTKDKYRTWNQWRGYDMVRTLVGTGAEQTRSETHYFRGMNGDRLNASGGSKSVTLVDSKGLLGTAMNDEDEYAGQILETIAYSGPSGSPLSGTVSKPWRSDPPTATRVINSQTVNARFADTADHWTWSILDGGRPDRITYDHTDFDSLGMPTAAGSEGDPTVTGDEKCTLTEYARNATGYLMSYPKRVREYATTCATAQSGGHTFTAAEIVGEKRTSYDNQSWGTPPVTGNVTQVDSLKDWVGNAFVPLTTSRSAFDPYGRVTDSWDVDGMHTVTAYTPTADAPTTSISVQVPTPAGQNQWTTSTTVEPAWGSVTKSTDINGKVTELSYDALGRRTGVWKPGRAKASTPSVGYVYTLSNTVPSAVETKTLSPNGTQISTFDLFDALMRPRQSQAPLASGGAGRIVKDTFYDSAGRVWRTYGPYVPPGQTINPSTSLWVQPGGFGSVDAWIKTEFDPAGRKTADVQFLKDVEFARTTYAYPSSDRTDVTPPKGGTATSSVTDAAGRVVQLRQHHDRTAISTAPSTFDATTYEYTLKGEPRTLTNVAGTQWTWHYDIRGHQDQSIDPDKGQTDTTYDDAGRVSSVTDARGAVLWLAYDSLGRKSGLYNGSIAPANQLSAWRYDEVPGGKGVQTSSTRYGPGGTSGPAYTNAVTTFSPAGLPSQQKVSIPAAEAGLSGDYIYDLTYRADGSPATRRLPAIPIAGGGLGFETLTFAYTTAGLPQKLSTSGTTWIVNDTSYTELGEVSTVTLRDSQAAPSMVWHRSYETGTRRLSRLWTTRDVAPTTVTDSGFAYDEAGNVKWVKENSSTAGTETQCFTHDYLRRLSEAWTPGDGNCQTSPASTIFGGPSPYWTQWDINPDGNRAKQTEKLTANGVRTTTYTYGNASQPHVVTGTSTVDNTGTNVGVYQYDQTGETTCRPVAAGNTCPTAGTTNSAVLSWDPEGHLATSTDSSGATSFIYDADGNQLIRKDPAGKTLYLPGQELRVNTSNAFVSSTRYYAWAGQVAGMRSTTGGLTWLSPDRQGTSNITIAAGTQAVAIRRQDPYGNPRGSATGTWPSAMDKGYQGGTRESAGVTHLGAREYDPLIGRFLSVDPVFDSKDPQSLTGYAYSGNSPVVFADPAGTRRCPPDDDGCVEDTKSYGLATVHRPSDRVKRLRSLNLFGRPLTDEEYAFYQWSFGYEGSQDFTVEDAINHWKKGEGTWKFFSAICGKMGGNAAACAAAGPMNDANPLSSLTAANTPIITVPAAVILAIIAYRNGEPKKGTGYLATALSGIPIVGDATGPIAKFAADGMHDDPGPNLYRPGAKLWISVNGDWSPTIERKSIKSGWTQHTVLFPMPRIFADIDLNDPTFIGDLQEVGFIS